MRYFLTLCWWTLWFTGQTGAQCIVNGYVSKNDSQLGMVIPRQQVLSRSFCNLKGPVKKLTQDGYDEKGLYLSYEKSPGLGYTYVFDENQKVVEYWLYKNRDEAAIKEIYYDFAAQRPRFFMEFSSPGQLALSTTYLYNNRGMCIGTKTTSGDLLKKNNFDLFKLKDTSVVASSSGQHLYLNGLLIEKADDNFTSTEYFKYFKNDVIKEWKLFEEGQLREVIEFDETGRMMERQFFKNEEHSLIIDSHLIVYQYNDNDLVSEERHRFTKDENNNFIVSKFYNYSNQLIKKVIKSNSGSVQEEVFEYNDRGDLTFNGAKAASAASILITYKDYDQYGNWLSKIEKTPKGQRRFERRIEYFREK